MASTNMKHKSSGVFPLFDNVKNFPNKVALYDNEGSYTYANIFNSAKELSSKISSQLHGSLNERVLFLCPNDASYVITLWAIWLSGQTAVPLSHLHPEAVLQYYVNDTESKLLITTPQHEKIMRNISIMTKTNLFVIDETLRSSSRQKHYLLSEGMSSPLASDFYEKNNALILYTSGTTGNPKGVVLSHKNILVQTQTLVDAWKWTPEDTILHTLPLHHVHGIVNALFCPLYCGATAIMLPKFSAATVWSYLLGRNTSLSKQNINVNVFMAVPTIYSKLIDEFKQNLENSSEPVRSILEKNVRLMVSGSAPLPVPLYEKWLEISGHRLLERYGMTEIGMCLSNLYDSNREPGYVGVPLPGVSVRIAEHVDNTYETLLECTNQNGKLLFSNKSDGDVKGELLVKGEGIFKEYFNKPEATKTEFLENGWFKTGDVCEYSSAKNKFRMLGRTSVDIIKSGGYKISALQVETKLLAHPDIKECIVVGIPDEVWGEKIAAVIVPAVGSNITLNDLRSWAEDKMPKYTLPTILKIVAEIPKNAMGKVNKKEIKNTMF